MKRKLKRFALVLVAVPALTLAMSGCASIGKPAQFAKAPGADSAPVDQQAESVPSPQRFSFASSREESPQRSRTGGDSGFFGFLKGGC